MSRRQFEISEFASQYELGGCMQGPIVLFNCQGLPQYLLFFSMLYLAHGALRNVQPVLAEAQ